MFNGSNCVRKSRLSRILTEPLNPRAVTLHLLRGESDSQRFNENATLARYFPKGISPRPTSQVTISRFPNFPKVMLGFLKPSAASKISQGAERYSRSQDRFEKFNIWEVAIWENAFGKVPYVISTKVKFSFSRHSSEDDEEDEYLRNIRVKENLKNITL